MERIGSNLFFNIEDEFREGIAFYVVIGGRRIGKTYSSMRYLMQDPHGIYVRNSVDEMEYCADPSGNPFKRLNTDMGINWSIEKSKKFYYIMDRTLPDEPRQMGIALPLFSFAKLKGADFSDTKTVVYDEFIPDPDAVKRFDEGKAFKKFYDTVNNNRDAFGEEPLRAILLSNAEDVSSKVLHGLGIFDEVEDMIVKGIKRRTIPSKRVKIIMPVQEELNALKEKTSLYQLIGKEDKYAQMALKNEFGQMSFANVRKCKLVEYLPVCAYEDLYIYKHKHRNEYYVCTKRADCEVYTERDTKVLFTRRWFLYRDCFLDGTFLYESFFVKNQFLELFF